MEMYLKNDFRIEKAIDGESAIQLSKEKRFHAILMDINLGAGTDGVQAMKQIKQWNGNDTIPVIAVTGYTSTEDKNQLLSAGFSAFLPKPFNRQSLISVIRETIQK